MQQRIHRRLHSLAQQFSDEDLFRLGELSFNEQFAQVEGGGQPTQPRTTSNLFGGLDRSVYMQQRVHRKLHSKAIHLSDEDLKQLGSLSFNEQFPFIEHMEQS